MNDETRVAVMGIVLDDPRSEAERVNRILSGFSDIIRGRMGLNFPEKQAAVISVVVQATPDQIGALSGKLGQVPNVSVKCAMTGKNI